MNNETKLILENQQALMNAVNYIMVTTTRDSGDLQRQIIEAYEKTRELLNPEEKPNIAEQTNDGLNVEGGKE